MSISLVGPPSTTRTEHDLANLTHAEGRIGSQSHAEGPSGEEAYLRFCGADDGIRHWNPWGSRLRTISSTHARREARPCRNGRKRGVGVAAWVAEAALDLRDVSCRPDSQLRAALRLWSTPEKTSRWCAT